VLDLQNQQQILLSKLAYYRKVINQRSEEYRQLKSKIAIPRIQRALTKISDGTYGICEACDERIPDTRLRAVPAALLCIDCQVKFETE
jgi:RNA polymerase-binding transcription factor DksA